jgi:hypothetical protein
MFFYVLSGQRILSEARLEYSVLTRPEPGAEQTAKAFEQTKLLIWLKGNNMRVDFDNTLRKQSVFFDLTDKKVIQLREAGQDRFQWNFSEEEWKEIHNKFKGAIWKEENETKEMNGFLCKKASIILTDSTLISLFYTTQVQPLNKSFDPVFEMVPGLPVSYLLTEGEIEFEFRLANLQTLPVSSSLFEIPASGYKILKAPKQEPSP